MKKNNSLPLIHAFDELKACEYLFKRNRDSKDKINKLMISYTNSCLKNDAPIEILKCVSKYLLYADIYNSEEDKKLYQTPSFVRKLLWKWLVVVMYQYIEPTCANKTLEQFDKGIDVYSLINLTLDDDSLYDHLLNDRKFTEKKLKNSLTSVKEYKKKNIIKLFRLNFDFFSYEPKLEFFVEGRHNSKLDLVVCEVMNDPSFFKFDFEILDLEEFKLNINKDIVINDTVIRNATTFMGLFVNKFIELNRGLIKEYRIIRNKINIYTLNKDFTISSVLNFIDNDLINEISKINYRKIIPFKVRYNDDIYLIYEKGVKKLKNETSEN